MYMTSDIQEFDEKIELNIDKSVCDRLNRQHNIKRMPIGIWA